MAATAAKSQSRNAAVEGQLRRRADHGNESVNATEIGNVTEAVRRNVMAARAITIPVLSRALSQGRFQMQAVGAMTSK